MRAYDAMSRRRSRRRRRGSHVVEFALLAPFYFMLYFGIIEYGWYFFQRSGVVDAARQGCRDAAALDPDIDPIGPVAEARMLQALGQVGIDCDTQTCAITVTDLSASSIPRLTCEISVEYAAMTGFVNMRFYGAVRLLPVNLKARTSAVIEVRS